MLHKIDNTQIHDVTVRGFLDQIQPVFKICLCFFWDKLSSFVDTSDFVFNETSIIGQKFSVLHDDFDKCHPFITYALRGGEVDFTDFAYSWHVWCEWRKGTEWVLQAYALNVIAYLFIK